ncbi:MAG TPA: nitroreductase family protein [Burkholderiaceae bacterium]|nr:nitroreductase family protein [Burkholderiaceae bacterium]
MSTVPLDLETDAVLLPPVEWPQVSLREALQRRCSMREFAADALPLATLSALLWAGFGVNRRERGGRTAPSAHDWQEIVLYAVLAEGAYRYDAHQQRLLLVKAEDLRRHSGTQDFVAAAPLNLVLVADFARMRDARDDREREFLAGADAGCIAQNIGLACAVLGLAAVVRGLIDRRTLALALALTPTQRIALAVTVGRPRSGAVP